MKIERLKILDEQEIKKIDQGSLEILDEVGMHVDVKRMRRMLADVGCRVDEKEKRVRFRPDFVSEQVKKAPRKFTLGGADPKVQWEISPDTQVFGGLGTLINIYDLETGQYRQTTLQDQINHLVLFDNLEHIVSNQMDIWPHDIPMHTIHVEGIRAWMKNCTKSFGMGAYGVMATRDMMEMVAMAMGGKKAIQDRHPFATIVSIHSPLSTVQAQLEGLMILAEHGQPALMSPEAMAGMTAPATLAGLLVQHNAEILAHIVMAQVVNPGTPVMYGTVSTIAEMRRATVALGAVETGLISAASTQLAHHYGIPCRAVGGGTEAKTFDLQCGFERERTIMMAAMAGANYITCVGTTESSMAGGHELAVIDNELIGMTKRALAGIEVTDETLALDVVKQVGPNGNYIMEAHTLDHFRKEQYLSDILDRDMRDVWEEGGKRDMVVRAREKALKILAGHRERELDPALEKELDAFVKKVAARDMDEFMAAEWET
ncbi:MAG: hypothetical protein GY866_24165 [Proteobacteria bacterium]|nr:hypothetical protein [Pseudomonadota bacterium]